MKNIPSDAESRLEQDNKMKVLKKAIAQLKIHQETFVVGRNRETFLTLNFNLSFTV